MHAQYSTLSANFADLDFVDCVCSVSASCSAPTLKIKLVGWADGTCGVMWTCCLVCMQPSRPDDMIEGGTIAFVSMKCFETLRAMADAIIKWSPNGSILIGFQLTVVGT